ncbi:sulfurtransferase TusA family protein [Oceanisphaera avium]|uniref:SirA family protein n=1 Tax=Oceanisphaera avium TaxID=1903694 RepID=A0A1Y0D0C4_9GAMM|nr:sulfurtransferase TusA family protein [Oceanisphaera avium]ART81029.1 SirA family protein [Oceanisphaera avium]
MDILDARELRCPLPLLQLKLWLKTATPGQQLRLCITDAGSRQDIPVYLSRMGHSVLIQNDDPHALTLLITKVVKG